MARITVEDCLHRIPNLFDLVLTASKRSRRLANGAESLVEWENDKPTVVALREIAGGHVGTEILEENEHQKALDAVFEEEVKPEQPPQPSLMQTRPHPEPNESTTVPLSSLSQAWPLPQSKPKPVAVAPKEPEQYQQAEAEPETDSSVSELVTESLAQPDAAKETISDPAPSDAESDEDSIIPPTTAPPLE